MALVSVIIPMFNASPWVSETIASMRAQSMGDFECIVVDDGSTDSSGSVAARAISGDARFRIVRQENRGLSGARNRGIEESTGKYLLFLDADDWLEPCALKVLAPAAMRARGGCAAGWNEWRRGDGASTGWVSDWLRGRVGLAELLDRNRFPTHALLLAREAIGADRFDTSLTAVEDYDMWLRLAARGVSWDVVERVTCGYRLRAASMSHGYLNMGRCTRVVVSRAFERARAGGTAGVDATEAAERRVLVRHLLALGSAAAVAGDDAAVAAHRAMALLEGVAAPGSVMAEACIVGAKWMAPFALGLPPCAWGDGTISVERVAPRLAAWWEMLERRGWAGRGMAEEAIAGLPRCIVGDRETVSAVVASLLAQGGREHGVVVVGAGQNGMRVVRALAELGVRVRCCDDAWRLLGEVLPGVRVGPVEEPAGTSSAPVVVTPSCDGSLVERVRGWSRPVVRWSVEQDRLAARHALRIAACVATGVRSAAG